MPRMEKAELPIIPQARRAAWIVLILVYSIVVSIIGWGIVHLVVPSLISQ